VGRQRRLDTPLVDLDLFRSRRFSTAIGVNLVTTFALVGSSLFAAQYLQLVVGLTPLAAGLWSLPAAGAVFVGAALAAAASRAVGPAYVVGGGMAIAAIGFGMLTQVGPRDGLAVVVIGSAVLAAGVSMVLTLAADLVLGTAPAQRAGSASGLSETASELGGALGVAVLGSIGIAIYRSSLGADLPAAIPADAAEAARETLAGALVVASQLEASAGAALADAARAAFTVGLQVAAAAGAAVMVVSAVTVAVVLRDVRPVPSDAAEGERATTMAAASGRS
jgi:DHA2 family multidrug resistance protein-like MFS transporter